jgi:hypothetical protein
MTGSDMDIGEIVPKLLIEHTGRPFLPKPFTPDELRDIVTRTLREVEK